MKTYTTEHTYQLLAQVILARENCEKTNNTVWYEKHKERANRLMRELAPSGAGFDSGTTIDWERSRPERILLNTSFHHMDETGFYDGWTDHTVTVTPSLAFGCNIRVSGRNQNDIKDYITEVFSHFLDSQITEMETGHFSQAK